MTEVRVERFLTAPVEDVFRAWTDAASMAKWIAPGGRAEVEADVRVGGRLHVVMIGQGMRIEHTGEYLIVDPPHTVSFTWRSQYAGDESVVTVSLTSQEEGTRLVLVHERLPEDAVASHEGGWGAILDQLSDALRAEVS